MAEELKITITATDGASRVFSTVERSATSMGDAIEEAAQNAGGEFDAMVRSAERAGDALEGGLSSGARSAGDALNRVETEAEQAGTAMEQAGQASARAGVNMDQLAAAGARVGQGLAAISGAFVIYAGQARDYELGIAALGRTYGETADQFVQLANQLQSTTIFSNDQVIEAANLMGTLKRNYELTDQQIQQLIITSADLAAVNGTTLADAAQRVAAAIRGEAESAEMLGLTMNQAAIDHENLTLSMSNAEAGAFRFNALMEQSAFATGAAGEVADTTTGQVQKLANEVQDAAVSFVEWTGPIGGVAAGLTSFGLEAGLAVGGLARLAQGMKDASSAAGGFSTVLKAAALSPAAGLGALVVGAGLAVIAVRNVARSFDDDYYQSVASAIEQTEMLDAAVLQLIGTMDSATLALDVQSTTAGITDITSAFTGLSDKLLELKFLQEDTDPLNLIGTVDQDKVDRLNELTAELAALEAQYGALEPAAQAATEAASAWYTIISNQAPGADAAIQTAVNLFDQYERGEISLTQLRDALNGVVADLPNYTTQALEAAAATETQTAAINANTSALGVNANEISRHDGVLRTDEESIHQWAMAVSEGNTATNESTVALEENTEAIIANNNAKLSNGNVVRDSEESIHQWAMAVSEGNTSTETATETTTEFTEGMAALDAQMAAYIDTLHERREAEANVRTDLNQWIEDQVELNDALGIFAGNMDGIAQRLNETEVAVEGVSRAIGIAAESVERGQDIWTAYNDALEAVGDNLGAVADMDVLGGTSNTIIGQTQSWGRLSQSVADWAGGLAHGLIAQTALDQAMLGGLISRKTYRDALEANHEIQVANAEIQEDLLRIQIKQMPIMAQAIQQQAEYIDGLADLGPEAQLAALGFMDQAQAAKALEIAQLAAASATESQQAATSEMITQMAMADPVLAAMLEKMGLISIGADGKITVNFDEAESATDAMDRLTESIDALIIALGGVPPIHIDDSEIELAKNEVEDLRRLLEQPMPTPVMPDMDLPIPRPEGNLIMSTLPTIPEEYKDLAIQVRVVDNATAELENIIIDIEAVPTSKDVDITANDGASAPAEAATGSIKGIPESWFTDILANDGASDPAITAKGNLDAIPRNVSTSITASSNVPGTVEEARRALDSISGKTVYTYVETVAVGGRTQTTARDGGVLGYANGGVVASLAEAGPELLRFRDGGAAVVPHPGIYMVERGTSVLPAPATAAAMGRASGGVNAVNYYGPVTQTVTYDQSSFAQRRAGLNRARGY